MPIVNILQALELLNAALTAVGNITAHAQSIGEKIKKANDEGRDLTDAEISSLVMAANDAHRAALDAIEAADPNG